MRIPVRLFISHASEDKADFVRPLAEALRREFEVWYDEYELTLGDSLLIRINEGLASCDFAVVVLSHAFFQKKWTNSELDGLFALETTSRKIILPIWKDVSFEDVKSFSPVLAGRLGGSASGGVEKAVSDIRKAVEVSNRTREISVFDSVLTKAKMVDQSLKERDLVQKLSRSEEGVSLVKEGFASLWTAMKSCLDTAQGASEFLKFNAQLSSHSQFGPEFSVKANYQLTMLVTLLGLGGNYTYEAELAVLLYKRNIQEFAIEGKPDTIRDFKFSPTFQLPKQLAWADQRTKKLFSTADVANVLLEAFITEIERRSHRDR